MIRGGQTLRVAMLGSEEFDVRPGGLNRYFADLRAAMAAEGHDLSSVTIDRSTSSSGTSFRRMSRTAWRTGTYAARAFRATRRTDVIDGHFALYSLIPFLMRRRALRVVHFHGPWAAESTVSGSTGRAMHAVKRAVEATVYRRAAHVITLSGNFADVVQTYGVAPSAVSVIPPGVDLARFHDHDRAGARLMFALGDADFVFVCARRLERRMGIDRLLEAFDLVHARHPHVKLLIAGTGSQQADLERLIARQRSGCAVRLLGRVADSDLAALYRAADCSVVPTLALEGFGLVLLESLASGTPVVASDIGGIPEALEGLDHDLLVPPGDIGALAARLGDAVTGRLPSRAACRAHAESFAWSSAARQHAHLYSRLLKAHAHG